MTFLDAGLIDVAPIFIARNVGVWFTSNLNLCKKQKQFNKTFDFLLGEFDSIFLRILQALLKY